MSPQAEVKVGLSCFSVVLGSSGGSHSGGEGSSATVCHGEVRPLFKLVSFFFFLHRQCYSY